MCAGVTGASNNQNDSFSCPFLCLLLRSAPFSASTVCPALLPPLVFPFLMAWLPLGSPCSSCPGGKGRRGNVLLWAGGGGLLRPVPCFPLRREILAVGVGVWGGRRDGGGPGGTIGGGGSRRGNLGGGWGGGVHAPKAKLWLTTGSPYLPLPSVSLYHHLKPNPNLCSKLVQPC